MAWQKDRKMDKAINLNIVKFSYSRTLLSQSWRDQKKMFELSKFRVIWGQVESRNSLVDDCFCITSFVVLAHVLVLHYAGYFMVSCVSYRKISIMFCLSCFKCWTTLSVLGKFPVYLFYIKNVLSWSSGVLSYSSTSTLLW